MFPQSQCFIDGSTPRTYHVNCCKLAVTEPKIDSVGCVIKNNHIPTFSGHTVKQEHVLKCIVPEIELSCSIMVDLPVGLVYLCR
jgi:hypothetical protein